MDIYQNDPHSRISTTRPNPGAYVFGLVGGNMIYFNDETEDLTFVYCPTCDEEYELPEMMTECPICGKSLDENTPKDK